MLKTRLGRAKASQLVGAAHNLMVIGNHHHAINYQFKRAVFVPKPEGLDIRHNRSRFENTQRASPHYSLLEFKILERVRLT